MTSATATPDAPPAAEGSRWRARSDVAGLAALWAETTGYRGRELWATLMQNGTRLIAPSLDVGAGLALAP